MIPAGALLFIFVFKARPNLFALMILADLLRDLRDRLAAGHARRHQLLDALYCLLLLFMRKRG